MTPNDAVSLKEYFESRCAQCRALMDERFEATEKSTELARTILSERLHNLNEARAEALRKDGVYFTKVEHELFRGRIDDSIAELRQWKATQEGKASQAAVLWAYIFAGVGVLIGFVSLVFQFMRK